MKDSEGCDCGCENCEHPNEAEYFRLAEHEAPRILEKVKAGLKIDAIDRILLRIAGKEVPEWKKKSSKKG